MIMHLPILNNMHFSWEHTYGYNEISMIFRNAIKNFSFDKFINILVILF